ncbi:hypothetical protein [Porphyromonas phage phage007a_Bg4]|uniref:Uncharacterized protein n=7 Tax=Viruses TaxID=10239 RepID=A0AAT9JHN2_9CAUD
MTSAVLIVDAVTRNGSASYGWIACFRSLLWVNRIPTLMQSLQPPITHEGLTI